MFMILRLVALGVALLAPFMGYGWGRFKGVLERREAVAAEHIRGVETCNTRVLAIQTTHEEAVSVAVKNATDAATTVTETPIVPSELQALCDASPTCRSRRTK